jgi:hypothetical protein
MVMHKKYSRDNLLKNIAEIDLKKALVASGRIRESRSDRQFNRHAGALLRR